MKTFLIELKTSILLTLILAVVTCGAYPLIVYGAGKLAFHHQADGSLIESDGKVVGSALLGQPFASAKYFHPRPSAAGTGYDASSSSGTNLGPTSQKLLDAVKAAAEQYRAENQLTAETLIPADAVTSSASGLDPHISVANARLQAKRVATARQVSEADIEAEIAKATDQPTFGILGDAGVNVLVLNLALDARSK